MLNRHIHQDIALEEQNACVAGSAAVANLFYLHLRLHVVGKSPKGPGSISEAGGFDLHFAAIAAVCRSLKISKTIFFEDRRVSCIRRGRIFGGLYALGIDTPAAEGLRQRSRNIL